MENFFDNSRIINTVWKWKFHIIAVVLAALVVSAVISGPFFIKQKFKSTARVYPVNFKEASEESESEHLLEYLMSHDIKFRVIDAFKLDEVYKIKREDPLYLTYILYQYNKHIKYRKTDFETIEISVLDEDPHRAAIIADSIIVFLNEAMLKEERKVHLEKAEAAKMARDRKLNEIDSVLAIVNQIRKETGLVDYRMQAQTATEGLMQAAARGGDRKPAQEAIKQLIERGGEMRKHQEIMDGYEVAADTLQRRYDKSMLYATQDISFTKVVERPFAADKKAYPIRWLIVFLSVFAAGFISVITVLLIDYIRDVRATVQ
jgi:capsular polysaccharide biosynthesis protein